LPGARLQGASIGGTGEDGAVTERLIENPLLLLFVVVAIGYPLGKVSIRGVSLGVASVLFAGLALGAYEERLHLPDIVYQLGLVLFVYTVGLAHGRAFFASFRRQGARNALFAAGVVALGAAVAGAAYLVTGIEPEEAAGLFAGGMTNTPALAAEIEYLSNQTDGVTGERLTRPVVGYSVAYPVGVLGVVLAVAVAQRLWRIDYRTEARRADVPEKPEPLENLTVRVTRPEVVGRAIDALVREHGWKVVFGRVRHDGRVSVASGETVLERDDLVSVIGARAAITEAAAVLGEPVEEHLEFDRTAVDFRRIFVSSPAATGRRLRELDLPHRFGAVVTRIRRGDVELLPEGDTLLQPGDRVRVVAPRPAMPAVTAFFGDSYRALSEIDVLTFSLGLALGLLLGTLPIPLPGGVDLELGLAGGPLLVALVLGALDRTGPLEWALPYSANLTLRQIGLILFLAGVGIRAGNAFVSTVQTADGLVLFAAGAAVTLTTALATLLVGYRALRIPMGTLAGMTAGIQTQPAVLGFALEQSKDDLPNAGYAAVFPIATIAKIVAAQLLLALLLR
jgi:putative transport protein